MRDLTWSMVNSATQHTSNIRVYYMDFRCTMHIERSDGPENSKILLLTTLTPLITPNKAYLTMFNTLGYYISGVPRNIQRQYIQVKVLSGWFFEVFIHNSW